MPPSWEKDPQLDQALSALIWTGRSPELVDHPTADPSTWAGSVQADMARHREHDFILPQLQYPAPAYERACLIMMARDEADIIETNIRWHHTAGFRRMVVSDNNSTDGSLQQLFALREQLPDTELIILSDPIERYMQAHKMTGLANFAAAVWPDCTWVFPIDADEFLVPTHGLAVLDQLDDLDGLVISKTNHVLEHPLMTRPNNGTAIAALPFRTPFGLYPPKVAMRPRPGLGLSQGNHDITGRADRDLRFQGGLAFGFYYREFNIRSYAQFCRKVTNGGRAVLRAEQHLKHEVGGNHWKVWYQFLQDRGETGLLDTFRTQFVHHPGAALVRDPFLADDAPKTRPTIRVACTMMQKNEDALLEPWLKYHGELFGFENLFVHDNGSTSPPVLDTLLAYAAKGVTIDRTHATTEDYTSKGEIIAKSIRALQEQQRYDLIFPLDCDEFVVLKDGAGVTANRERILAYAETALPGTPPLLRVDTQFFNVINHPGQFARNAYFKTAIVLDGTFLSSDHGHHYCTTTAGAEYRPCEFAYVHYHYKPLAMLREHARAKLAPFVNVDDPSAVAAFTGAGYHLRPYLTMTEDEFQNWHKGDNFYVFQEFNDRLAALGAPIPF